MLAKVKSCALLGVDAQLVEVEVDASNGQPGISIVGLPGSATREAKDRVWAALRNSGLSFPGAKKLTINLAPADLRKDGTAYDLPIALGLLVASGQMPQDALEGALALGELSLDGGVRHVRGAIAAAALCRELGYRRLFLPAEDAAQAAVIPEVEVIPVHHLIALVEHLLGVDTIPEFDRAALDQAADLPPGWIDFADIKGQEHVKRALEVAAAGGHNLLMTGPPGSGKTLMARAMPAILPQMNLDEALEVTRIYSIADELRSGQYLVQGRPFRAPHHTISEVGLVGGGSDLKPGEVSKAHRGVLFLDELPEFGHNLEVLRQPMEDRAVTISRASGTVTFPANFMLIAASNPCPCGYYGDPSHRCTCSPTAVARYNQRISGPLADRIDIHIEVPHIPYEKLTAIQAGEPSAGIRGRVQAARSVQAERFTGTPLINNADMGAREITAHCTLDAPGQALMKAAMNQMQLSARAYHRVLKVSRTIADLAGCQAILAPHLAEALQYRVRQNQ